MRVRLVRRGPDGQWIEAGESATDEGVAAAPDASPSARRGWFAETLRRRVAALPDGAEAPPLPLVVSGMAGSNRGWQELPYASTPFPLDGGAMVCRHLPPPPGLGPVLLASGVRTATEIMRGEETEMIGLVAALPTDPSWQNGWLLLPGTHSKHCRIRDAVLEEFHTAMTGEVFQLLSSHGLLAHAVIREPPNAGDDHPAFFEGVAAAIDTDLLFALFQVRTRQVLRGASPESGRAFLSGLLIGAELRPHIAEGPSGPPILVAADEARARLYCRAAAAAGLEKRLRPAPPGALRRGLVLAHARLLEHFPPPPGPHPASASPP